MAASSLGSFACLCLLWLSCCGTTLAVMARTTDFIDCSDPCQGGDVNYHLIASIRTMKMMNYTYRGRTYSREGDGDDSFMGPTLHVRTGQSLWIKLENQMFDSTSTTTTSFMGPNPPTVEKYWNMLQHPGEHIKYQYYKPSVASPQDMEVDEANLPHAFDATNLHLHGLDVEVHMFDPVGTHHPDAKHIQVEPGQCYCYRFQIPNDHPAGLYWYHPHLHGSTAIQMWSGMLGVLYVEEHLLLDELASYSIHQSREMVVWDPAFQYVSGKATHNLEVDEFLMGQTTLSKIHPFLVNGQYNPTLTTDLKVGQVLHIRLLCALVENEHTFIVYPQGRETEPWDEAAVPFWVIGADGVTYPKVSNATNILVVSGGQRYELLLQFDKPGTYVISQQGVQGMQFFDMWGHPHDQILATIVVVDDDDEKDTKDSVVGPSVPFEEMEFAPGYAPEETISADEIVATETIVFSMGANRNQAPFPQYYVNGLPFHPNRLDFFAHPGEAREYILVNANHNVHPFHIHVNRFQVQEMGSELSTETYPVLKAVMEFDPTAWRDTVVVPPNGRARIWVRFKSNYTGKTVLHCHFLAHEDTGMMSTLFLGHPDYVFRWHEHAAWIVALVAGTALGCVAAIWFGCLSSSSSSSSVTRKSATTRRTPKDTDGGGTYTAVEMNAVKSKAMD